MAVPVFYQVGVVLAVSNPPEFRGFNVVWRGYDRRQVDRCLQALSEAGAPVDPPLFRIVGRGYDRRQVDVRIRDLLADNDVNG
ncbi:MULTISPECIES: hypothetical protein [unclassified Streptomyces]|uniref:hypothetical protein n=1 Tax=unclassified Streptomyces TaxID=2593676 RepID=UPI002E2BBD3F|nr:hypothetical protein [Streptomyces sp. NBC_00223]